VRSYSSPKVVAKNSALDGKGLFAIQHISKDELLIDFSSGPGKFISLKESDELYDRGYDYMIQVDDDLFFAAMNDDELEVEDFINHSCGPNCGIRGSLQIIATRDIVAGEEITFDYAMTESSDYSMPCKCGKENCRRIITGNDWKNEKLQQKYAGYFSEYLNKKISTGLYAASASM
jgi:SET domain-containing protein